MVNLNNILHNLAEYNIPPIIQRSDGLFEFAPSWDIMPTDQTGTNLWTYLQHSGNSITLLGSWNTDNYEYNSETGQWYYFSDIK